MTIRFALIEYVEGAMAGASYDKLEDGMVVGRVPGCKGVIAFGATLRECEEELGSTLEDWTLVGLKLQHSLPIVAGIKVE
jgi:predicted RNase H-like HicB family nuclease